MSKPTTFVSGDEFKKNFPSPAAPKRILVMEDDNCMRTALVATLESQKFHVNAVVKGEEAIEYYTKAQKEGNPFDAVILDLTIRGGMGGKQTIDALLQLDPNVRAIVMSGYSEDPVVTQPELYGFKAAMEKSFDANQLLATINRILL